MKKGAIIAIVLVVAVPSLFVYHEWQEQKAKERERKFGYTFSVIRQDAINQGWDKETLKRRLKEYESNDWIITPEMHKRYLAKKVKEKEAITRAKIETAIILNGSGETQATKTEQKEETEIESWKFTPAHEIDDGFIKVEEPKEPAIIVFEKKNKSIWEPPKSKSIWNAFGTDSDDSWTRTSATQSIKANAYGLGTHSDQYGRAVKVVPKN